jgi:amino acid transporter
MARHSSVNIFNLQNDEEEEIDEHLDTYVSPHTSEIPKHLNVFSGIAVIVGNMVGTGIFRTVGTVHLHVGSVGVSLLIWIFAGLLSMCGALCYIELGSTFPHSGGDQVYLTEIYGSILGFLYTWVNVIAIRPGGIAITAITFAEYMCDSFENLSQHQNNITSTSTHPEAIPSHDSIKAPVWMVKIVGVLFVIAITWINIKSSRWSSKINNSLFFVKIAMLSFISITGWIILIKGHEFKKTVANGSLNSNWFEGTENDPSKYALGFYAALWAYDGW